MARSLLKFGLLFIGIAAVLIGLMFVALGVKTTAAIFNAILSIVHDGGVMSGVDNPNADSELRFYSVIWIGYGIVMAQTAQNLSRHMGRVPFLLMGVELILPVVLGICYLRVRRGSQVS